MIQLICQFAKDVLGCPEDLVRAHLTPPPLHHPLFQLRRGVARVPVVVEDEGFTYALQFSRLFSPSQLTLQQAFILLSNRLPLQKELHATFVLKMVEKYQQLRFVMRSSVLLKKVLLSSPVENPRPGLINQVILINPDENMHAFAGFVQRSSSVSLDCQTVILPCCDLSLPAIVADQVLWLTNCPCLRGKIKSLYDHNGQKSHPREYWVRLIPKATTKEQPLDMVEWTEWLFQLFTRAENGAVRLSDKGMGIFVHYQHARIHSILASRPAPDDISSEVVKYHDPAMVRLSALLYLFPHLLEISASDPAPLVWYLLRLAKLSSVHYQELRVKGINDPLSGLRWKLWRKIYQAMDRILYLLGGLHGLTQM